MPGWVRIVPSPTLRSPWKSDSVPWAVPGGSSPAFSKLADRIRSSPVGRSSVASIRCSVTPAKLFT